MRCFVVLIVMLSKGTFVVACSLCESETGRQVRAGIFDEQFGYHLLITVLPFPVLLVITALIHFGWSWPKDGQSKAAKKGVII